MSNGLQQVTNLSDRQYSPQMTGGGSSLQISTSPAISKVENFTNDIDNLTKGLLGSAKAYFQLSDDAVRQVATDHLVQYKTKQAEIMNNPDLSPQDKKIQLGNALNELTSTTADKVDDDRFNSIYKSSFLDVVKPAHATNLGLLDSQQKKIDDSLIQEKAISIVQAGGKWEDVYDTGKDSIFKDNPELVRKFRDAYVSSKKDNLDNEINMYALEGKNWHIENLMTKQSDGSYRYDVNKAKSTFNRLGSGYFNIEEDGNINISDNTSNDIEKRYMAQEFASIVSAKAKEASAIEEASIKEARKARGEFSALDKISFDITENNLAEQSKSFEPVDNQTIQDMLSIAEINLKSGNVSKANDQIDKAINAVAQNKAIGDLDSNVNILLNNPDSKANVSILSKNILDGTVVEIPHPVTKELTKTFVSGDKIKKFVSTKLESKVNEVIGETNFGDVNSVNNARSKLVAIQNTSSSLNIPIDSFKKAVSTIDSGLLGSNPTEVLANLNQASLVTEFYDKEKSSNYKALANRATHIIQSNKDKPETEVMKLLNGSYGQMKTDYNVKHNKELRELSTSLKDVSWFTADKKINNGTLDLAVKIFNAKGVMPNKENIANMLVEEGGGNEPKLVSIGSALGSAGRSIFEFAGFDNQVVVISPTIKTDNGSTIYLGRKKLTEAFDGYMKEKKLSFSDYEVDSADLGNGQYGLKLIDKKNGIATQTITGSELIKYIDKNDNINNTMVGGIGNMNKTTTK